MRASSPPIATFQTPLKGMDCREVRSIDAPNLLFNIDLSNRGFWQNRPGVRKLFDVKAKYGIGAENLPIVGIHSVRSQNKFYIIAIYAQSSSSQHRVLLLDEFGKEVWLVPELLDGDPYNPESRYEFITAGRFVYFCNGEGFLWELEIKEIVEPILKKTTLEVGNHPLTLSYITDFIRPSSLTYFYEQVVLSGFKSPRLTEISKVSDPPDPEHPWPPKEVLNAEKTEVLLDPGCVFVAEPGLWRSYPIEDPSGFYWVYNEPVIATAGIGTTLLVFGQKRLYAIIGHGQSPSRTRLAEVSLASPQAICYFDRYIFFVAQDGCYITDGGSVRKVSHEMDPLWFSRTPPETTRAVQQNQLVGTGYPFYVNTKNLKKCFCINDRTRQQVMVFLSSNGSPVNNMAWVYNYADMTEGIGGGKWSIWAGATGGGGIGTSLPAAPSTFPTNPAAPTWAPGSFSFTWNCATDDFYEGDQRIFSGNAYGDILEFGTTEQDYLVYPTWNAAGVAQTSPTTQRIPVVVSLGRVGRVDSDGRIICTDVAVRRKQLSRNYDDDAEVSRVYTNVRSEGEGLKHFDARETDVEFESPINNMQNGVSENTKSILNVMKLGNPPAGDAPPLMASEYFEAYARVNVPDEEGRAAYVDIYSVQAQPSAGNDQQPHKLQISEVRVHANVKGGSQREQS